MLDSDDLAPGRDPSNWIARVDTAQVEELKIAQEELSRTVRNQNFSMSRSCAYWEDEFATALRGLQDVESVTDTLQRAILELKRNQDLNSSRQKHLEEESAVLRTYIEDALRAIKGSYADGYRMPSLRKERQAMEDFQERWSDRHDSIQGSVKKVERDITVLRGKLQNNNQAVIDLLARLESTQEVAHSSDTRLTEVEQVVDALWDLLKDVRDTLHVLSMRKETLAPLIPLPSSDSSPPLLTLEEEINMSLGRPGERTDNAEPLTAQGATIDADGWWSFRPNSMASCVSQASPLTRQNPDAGEGSSSLDDTPSNMALDRLVTGSQHCEPVVLPIRSSGEILRETVEGPITHSMPLSGAHAGEHVVPTREPLSLPPASIPHEGITVDNSTSAVADVLPVEHQEDDTVPSHALVSSVQSSKQADGALRDRGGAGAPLSPLRDILELYNDRIINFANRLRGSTSWTMIVLSTVCFVISCYLALNFWCAEDAATEHQLATDNGTRSEYPVWEWALQRT